MLLILLTWQLLLLHPTLMLLAAATPQPANRWVRT
jgi:hypothetical protein